MGDNHVGHEIIVADGQANATFPPPVNGKTVFLEYRLCGCVTWREA